MSKELEVASTTDIQKVVTAVADGDQEGGRAEVADSSLSKFEQSADGKVVSFESEQSERHTLLQRLAEAERDLIELPVEQADAESSEEGQPTVDESKLDIDDAMRRAALEDALADARRIHRRPYQEAAEIREQMGMAFAARFNEIAPPDIHQLAQDAVKNGPDVSVAVRDALLGLPGGPEATIYLLRHPEMRRQLAGEDDYVAVARVGELAGRLAGLPKRRLSSAPAPINPVGGSSTKSSLPPDEMNYQDFSKWRERQLKTKYRQR
jgi:hypothetical protein